MAKYLLTRTDCGFVCRTSCPGWMTTHGSFGRTAREAVTRERWQNRLHSGSVEQKRSRYPLNGFMCGIPKRLQKGAAL